ALHRGRLRLAGSRTDDDARASDVRPAGPPRSGRLHDLLDPGAQPADRRLLHVLRPACACARIDRQGGSRRREGQPAGPSTAGGEDRLDRAAGAAPGRPEVDHDGLARLEDVALEALVGDVAHGYSFPVNAASLRIGTFQTASSTIAPLILEPPASRSTNLIGTSTARKPARRARYVVSIWNA